jgi:hypothetical protein
MLPPVVVLFMIILLRTIVMDVALLAAAGLELWVSPLEVRAELLCLEAPGSHAVVRPEHGAGLVTRDNERVLLVAERCGRVPCCF